ncbi:unnamed protein product, partial [marine sediment metagenome]
LTYATGKYEGWKSPQQQAWQNIGAEYNAWITAVRQRYGKVSVFRVWEATKNAYPHIHLVAVFHEHEFRAFMHKGKSGKTVMRIHDRTLFQNSWHSNIDVQGIKSFKRGMSEILKYLKKSTAQEKKEQAGSEHKCFLDSCKGELTLAMCWFFNKQQYAVSGTFSGLITELHNSNMMVDFRGMVQSDIWQSGVKSVKYELLGIVPYSNEDDAYG